MSFFPISKGKFGNKCILSYHVPVQTIVSRFWDMTILYNDTLNWSDITPICELITELDFNTDLDLITEF